MKIRRMETEDLSQVAKIEECTFSMPWSREAFCDTINREDTLYLVAEEQGTILGYCGMWQSFGEGEIPNVAVSSEHRRMGVGEALLRTLFAEGEKRGVRAYTLEVRAGNAGAIRLYEKLGFVSEGIRPRFYRKPVEDAVIMWKR